MLGKGKQWLGRRGSIGARAGDHDGEVWQWRERENVDGFLDFEEGSLGSG
jgi:hypothetical protein